MKKTGEDGSSVAWLKEKRFLTRWNWQSGLGTFRRGVAHTEMGSSPGKSAAKTTRFKHWECELDSP